MAFKEFALTERTTVTIYKRKTSRNLRLSIAPGGQVKVSIPIWAPYSAGITFARSRLSWIESQQRPNSVLQPGQAIGKAHHLHFIANPSLVKPTSRIRTSEIMISYPSALSPDDPAVQKIAEAASYRALRTQAELLLPNRLASLAASHGFTYRGVSVKRLKSRWGSCDQHQNIVLNLFLMQLPWECIDYVLLHELVHTNVLRHGPDFWAELERVLPNVKRLRKEMRSQQPVLRGELGA
jgi:predicted metal-dependent hydrolase